MEKQISEKQREINQLRETINQNQEDNEKQKKKQPLIKYLIKTASLLH